MPSSDHPDDAAAWEARAKDWRERWVAAPGDPELNHGADLAINSMASVLRRSAWSIVEELDHDLVRALEMRRPR